MINARAARAKYQSQDMRRAAASDPLLAAAFEGEQRKAGVCFNDRGGAGRVVHRGVADDEGATGPFLRIRQEPEARIMRLRDEQIEREQRSNR